MLNTSLTSDWGLTYPIISAPMAGSAWGELARAVSAAGGLGMIGMGNQAQVSTIERESAIARDTSNGKFGIGLMIWALPARPELLDAALAAEPLLLSLSFGDPAPYVDRVRRAGVKLATQVNTRAQAVRALEADVDVIVAQGTEAGGHTGHVGTLPILQIVLDEVERRGGRTCVLAAGGIATGRGLAAVLAAGAAGAWIGTPLLFASEARITDSARERLNSARETDTILTRAFDVIQNAAWPADYAGRALMNSFAHRWTGREGELRVHPTAAQEYEAAAEQNDYSIAPIYAGQSAGLGTTTRPAAEIVREIGDDAEARLRDLSDQLIGP